MLERKRYLDRLWAFKDNQLIKVVTGLRRCGKSTMLDMFREALLQDGVAADHIIAINFELMEYDEIRDYRTFYRLVRDRIPDSKKCYLLFDEIQQVEHWEKAVNSLCVEKDIDVDIYITGSNAHLLSSEISTLLSGRYVEIQMLPLSFREYLQADHLPADWSVDQKFQQRFQSKTRPFCRRP